jgi:hypothetical protein
MTTLPPNKMLALRGSEFGRGEGGEICGFMVSSLLGGAYLFGPVFGSFVFMFTPAVCLLDYHFSG